MTDSNNSQQSGQDQSNGPASSPTSDAPEPSSIPPTADPNLISVVTRGLDPTSTIRNNK